MTRPLPYKKRVRLPPDTLEPEPRTRRRYSLSVLGALSYTALAGGAWALGTDRMPVERWLDQALAQSAPQVQTARPHVASFAPTQVQPATLEPAFPPPLKAESFQADAPPAAESATERSVEARDADFEPAPPPAAEPARPGPAPVATATRSLTRPTEAPAVTPPRAAPASPAPAPAPDPADSPPIAVSSGPSCEQAQATHGQEIVIGKRRAPDLPRAALSSVLNNGSVLAGCGVPERTQVSICTAIQNGRAVGVTVTTRPGNTRISSCVARKVRSLRFPSSPHLDVTHTRF